MMSIRFRAWTMAAVLLLSATAQARPVGQDALEGIVANWLDKLSAGDGWRSLSGISRFEGAPAETPVYVARLRPQGYVLLSGDTQLPPVLGFSFEHDLDLSPGPGNALRAMLDRDLNALKKHLAAGKASKLAVTGTFDASGFIARNESRWSKLTLASTPEGGSVTLLAEAVPAVIGPLLTTTWSQSRHYNFLAPAEPGCSTSGGPDYYDCKAPTGCVQTAWAQLMKYYQWPPHGSGSGSYTDQDGAMTGTHSASFADSYDWRNMLTEYDAWSEYPEANVAAVSELMYELAVIDSADFEASGTGAGSFSEGLIKNMHYQGGAMVYSNVPANLRTEIEASRPAVGVIPGHAIVLDGYRYEAGGDFFHVNYGWGGMNNGWYLLDGIPGGGLQYFHSGAKPAYTPIPVKANYVADSADIYLSWLAPKKVSPPITRFRVLVPSYRYNLLWLDNAADFSRSASAAESWCQGQQWSNGMLDGATVFYSGEMPCDRLEIKDSFIPDADATLKVRYQMELTNDTAMSVTVSEDGQNWQTVYQDNGSDSYVPPSWKLATIDLSPYAGKQINIRVNHLATSSNGWSYYYGGGIWVDWLKIANAIDVKWTPENQNILRTARNYTVLDAGTQIKAVRVEALAGGQWTGAAQIQVKGVGVASAAPTAPSDLVATAKAGGKVELLWLDNSKDESAFVLQRKPAGAAWANLVTLPANHNGHVDAGLTAGTQYYYRVKAVNGVGASVFSNTVAATATP